MRSIFSNKRRKDNDYNALQNTLIEKDKLIEKATSFIKDVENGNLETNQLKDVSDDNNLLAKSLLSMRDKMKIISGDERKRNWVSQGLAKFVDILRVNNDDINKLTEHIISNLLKYLDANQGALFILNDDSINDRHLEMVACYAYNKKKYFKKRIELGDGLTGQAFLEKGTIYLTDIPKDFVTITSGLGEALPTNVLIVPLKVNEDIYGIVEIASFSFIQPYQIEFVEKLGESIASTISNVKTNQQTKRLLIETQQQAEQMKTQEEEMRQNMEELKSTQEQMQRVLTDMEGKEAYVNQLLNTSSDLIYTVDRNYKLVTWNKAFAKSLDRFGMKLEKGVSTLDWYPLAEVQQQIDRYIRVFQGETFDVAADSEINGSTYSYLSAYAPLTNGEGEVYEAVIFAKDITSMSTAQKNLERVLTESQQKNEELKAQEEELRQNMEEMQATQEAMERKQEEIDRARAENEHIRQEEAERASKVSEMQKKTMLASTLKLKNKVEELQQMKEELIAQEEELRQNMEEMQATQETMIRKQEEVDNARAENERIKQEEGERALKVSEMQKKTMLASTLKLKSKVEELQQVKNEMDRIKEEEARRGLKISEMQKQAMNKLVIRLKATEDELKKVRSKIKSIQ